MQKAVVSVVFYLAAALLVFAVVWILVQFYTSVEKVVEYRAEHSPKVGDVVQLGPVECVYTGETYQPYVACVQLREVATGK